MTDRDPDQQREIDRAITWWTQHLKPRLLPGLDPEHVARQGVEAMHAEGWRPWPRSERIPKPGEVDPATAHAGAEKARAALRGEPT